MLHLSAPAQIGIDLAHCLRGDIEQSRQRIQLGSKDQNIAPCKKTSVSVGDHDANISSRQTWFVIDSISNLESVSTARLPPEGFDNIATS